LRCLFNSPSFIKVANAFCIYPSPPTSIIFLKEVHWSIKFLGATIKPIRKAGSKILEKELSEYFEGNRTEFTVPLDFVGSDFQKSVWEVLMKIPYGQTWSYAKQAEILGDKNKVRAVANANGMNKISILIPCHRVIGSDGNLTGYGGGIWRKQKLLELEKAILF
jgi:AraC family transcriptional regulator of adaptative response/methylated-DNA-[protein]-cysteine methyltransferase